MKQKDVIGLEFGAGPDSVAGTRGHLRKVTTYVTRLTDITARLPELNTRFPEFDIYSRRSRPCPSKYLDIAYNTTKSLPSLRHVGDRIWIVGAAKRISYEPVA